MLAGPTAIAVTAGGWTSGMERTSSCVGRPIEASTDVVSSDVLPAMSMTEIEKIVHVPAAENCGNVIVPLNWPSSDVPDVRGGFTNTLCELSGLRNLTTTCDS